MYSSSHVKSEVTVGVAGAKIHFTYTGCMGPRGDMGRPAGSMLSAGSRAVGVPPHCTDWHGLRIRSDPKDARSHRRQHRPTGVARSGAEGADCFPVSQRLKHLNLLSCLLRSPIIVMQRAYRGFGRLEAGAPSGFRRVLNSM